MLRRLCFILCLALVALSTPTPWEAQETVRAAEATRRFVVWSPSGLAPRVGRALERVDGVRDAVKARFALDWLLEARTRSGRRIQSPPQGSGYPFEVLLVAPGAYAPFAPAEDRAAVRHLGAGEVLLAHTASRVRAAGAGLRLRLRSGAFKVTDVVSDATTQGYEALMARPAPDDWQYQMRYFMVEADADVSRRAMRRAVRRVVGHDDPFRIRSDRQTRFLRYAVSVRPQMDFKKHFGEFAAEPVRTGPLTLTDGWRDNNIRSEPVPILGTVTCHRKLFPQLRGAMNELREKGLSHLVRRDEYAGCFNSRFVAQPAGIRLSRHAWGIAFDINTSNNGFGEEPHQDPRLVRVMRKWGFLWGGTWPLPDGMHFEWRRFPG